MSILDPKNCLFEDIQDPFAVEGWSYVQVPIDDESWDADDLAGARFIARSSDGLSVVTEFNGEGYRAFYVSYMPEFPMEPSPPNLQFLYNAIVCGRGATPVNKYSWGKLKTIYK